MPEAEEKKEKKEVENIAVSKPGEEKILAAPAVRKFAKQLDVDLAKVAGTGPDGIITEEDVKNAAGLVKKAAAGEKTAAKVTKKYDIFGYVDRVPLKGIKRITAEKMIQAVRNAALVTHHDHVDVTALSEFRKKQNENLEMHLTYLPFIIKATIEALKKHPYVASSVEENEIIIKKYYNIGVAVGTEKGLVVPVVKNADKLSIADVELTIKNFGEEILLEVKEK